jgi:hypothetical protein
VTMTSRTTSAPADDSTSAPQRLCLVEELASTIEAARQRFPEGDEEAAEDQDDDDEEDEDDDDEEDEDDDDDDEGESNFDSFPFSTEATVVGASSFRLSFELSFELSSAATIVFGILRLDPGVGPFTATVVLVTPLPLAGFAELCGLESALTSSAGKSVSTSPGFRELAAALLGFKFLPNGTTASLESSSDSEGAVASVSGAV